MANATLVFRHLSFVYQKENQFLNSVTRALLTMIFSSVGTTRFIDILFPNHTETSLTASCAIIY